MLTSIGCVHYEAMFKSVGCAMFSNIQISRTPKQVKLPRHSDAVPCRASDVYSQAKADGMRIAQAHYRLIITSVVVIRTTLSNLNQPATKVITGNLNPIPTSSLHCPAVPSCIQQLARGMNSPFCFQRKARIPAAGHVLFLVGTL